MQQANPFAAMADAQNVLGAAWDDRTRTQAGRAYAAGDQQGAVNALASGGQLEAASGMQTDMARQSALSEEQQRAAQEARIDFLGRTAGLFEGIPEAERDAAWQGIRPQMQGLFPEEFLARVDQLPKTDANLAAFSQALGVERQALHANDRAGPGGSILRPDPRTGAYTEVYAAPFDPRAGAAQGYMWADESRTRQVFIPGGPADPSVVGTRAAAGRAPPRGRSGGGGGSRATSSAPSQPARRPWERY